jgi:hypothetical protein
VRSAVRPLVKPNAPLPETPTYPGHYAVTRSVVEGLREVGADFNFNPKRFSDVGPVVYAPANEALRQAITMKREGRIDMLAAGPANVLVPEEEGRIIQAPEIDRLIIACEWARGLYAAAPQLPAKLRVCPAGIDVATWSPSGQPRTNRAVVYWKSGDEAFCAAVEAVIRRAGLEPVRVRSGHGAHHLFTPAQLHAELDTAMLGVYLSAFETQGIALAEAWAMDVPTLAWDPQADDAPRPRRFHAAGVGAREHDRRDLRAPPLHAAYRRSGSARSGMKSRPRIVSAIAFSPPITGIAFSALSAVPRKRPLRRIVEPIAATASAVPIQGMARVRRPVARRCP